MTKDPNNCPFIELWVATENNSTLPHHSPHVRTCMGTRLCHTISYNFVMLQKFCKAKLQQAYSFYYSMVIFSICSYIIYNIPTS